MTDSSEENPGQPGPSGRPNEEAADRYDDLLVLVVDDDANNLMSLRKVLERDGLKVKTATDGRSALEVIHHNDIAVMITDFDMPGMTGIDLLKSISAISPATETILITAYGTIELAVEAMKEGAYDFVVKPFKRHDILRPVRRALEKRALVEENRRLRAELENTRGTHTIIGQSLGIRETLELVEQVAPSTANVLITGESGTGKELIARAVHTQSLRAGQTFVAINCAAIPDTLLESELFGYEKGAFTGANTRREGRFERANKGTIFLDEIGDMPMHVQVKLLRVLQEGEIERLGGSQTIPVDCRIIAATNKDLSAEIKEGTFREDLYYRLNVIHIPLPPLRERRDDVPLLVHHFLSSYSTKNRKRIESVAADAMELLQSYSWPGNVRELENVMERAVVLCRTDQIELDQLPPQIRSGSGTTRTISIPLGTPLEEVEQRLILETLKMTKGDKRLAAQLLGIATRTIYRKLPQSQEVN